MDLTPFPRLITFKNYWLSLLNVRTSPAIVPIPTNANSVNIIYKNHMRLSTPFHRSLTLPIVYHFKKAQAM